VRVVGILLARDEVVRFGGDKLLEPLPCATDGCEAGTPIGIAACRHLGAAVSATLAVVRPSDTALATMLRDAGARVVECAARGGGHGCKPRLRRTATPDADGWLVALPTCVDQTLDDQDAGRGLTAGADIVAPSYNGERGHPVGFARRPLRGAIRVDRRRRCARDRAG